jgi:hypothetical protein
MAYLTGRGICAYHVIYDIYIYQALAPAPGEGPSKEAREGGCFNHHVMARGEEGSTIQNSRTNVGEGQAFPSNFKLYDTHCIVYTL